LATSQTLSSLFKYQPTPKLGKGSNVSKVSNL
jgi:hypothetical protein